MNVTDAVAIHVTYKFHVTYHVLQHPPCGGMSQYTYPYRCKTRCFITTPRIDDFNNTHGGLSVDTQCVMLAIDELHETCHSDTFIVLVNSHQK